MKAKEPSASYIIESLKRCWPKMSSDEKKAVREITKRKIFVKGPPPDDIGVAHFVDPKRPHPSHEPQAYQLTTPSLSSAQEESSPDVLQPPDQAVSQSQEMFNFGNDETRDSPAAPAPACVRPEVRRSSRANKGVTSKYD